MSAANEGATEERMTPGRLNQIVTGLRTLQNEDRNYRGATWDCCKAGADSIESLSALVASLAKDGERLDWLEDRSLCIGNENMSIDRWSVYFDIVDEDDQVQTLREAIDAAASSAGETK